jgi:protoporphyrinogen oxidase
VSPVSARVAVVGAGLAGLGAAVALRARGLEVACFEREERPGGRVASLRTGEFHFDLGDPLVSADAAVFRTLVDAVGLRDELLPLRPVLLAQASGGRIREIDPRSLAGVARIPGVRWREALRLVRFPRLLRRYARLLDVREPERAARWDDRSLADFARLYFGASVLERWMEPRLASRAHADAVDTSRALFLLLETSDPEGRLGLPRGVLAEVAEAAARRVGARFDHEVTQIRHRTGRPLSVSLRGHADGAPDDDAEPPFDAIVVATSAPAALRITDALLSPAEREFLSSATYQKSLTLHCGLRRSFASLPQLLRLPRAEHSPLESVLFEPGVAGGRAPAGAGIAVLRATPEWSVTHWHLPAEVAEKDLLGVFDRLYPGARRALVASHLERRPRAHPRFDVGRYRALERFRRVQLDQRAQGRRLYFANDYLALPTPEGALLAAERAVRDLCADLGI